MDSRLFQEQLYLENCAVEETRREYEEKLKQGDALPPHFVLLKMGIEPMMKALHEFKQPQRGGNRLSATRKMIRDIPTEELAYIILWNALVHIHPNLTIQRFCVSIGMDIETHIEYREFKEKLPWILKEVERNFKTNIARRRRAVILHAKDKFGLTLNPWTITTRFHVGLKMLELLIQHTGMFEIEKRVSSGKFLKYVVLSPATEEWMARAHKYCCIRHPKYHPCVIPPKPWTKEDAGGFYTPTNQTSLIKTRYKDIIEKVYSEGELDCVLSVLNTLQNTRWRINKKVLEIAEVAWATPSGLGVFPRPDAVVIPPTLWSTEEEGDKFKLNHPEEFKEWKYKRRDAYTEKARQESKFIQASRTLQRAKQFRDHEAIYFCWTMDYRGRFYPSQLYLNPQGADLCRGLLEFADGKALGEEGWKWLAVHGANCFGEDKITLQDRLNWVLVNQKKILECADNPIDGSRWWIQAEDPWQFLAFCFEWKGYTEQGASYISHLSVSQDGSCNGLQHFAMLMKDAEGGKFVNIVAQDKPNDVYQAVADEVARLVKTDLNDTSIYHSWEEDDEKLFYTVGDMARVWNGQVDRKLVKRGVMTTFYGVTSYGLREQIFDYVRKEELKFFDDVHPHMLVTYITSKMVQAIKTIASSASEVMMWFRHVAEIHAQAQQDMEWITPIGFKVVQRYMKQKRVRIKTYFGGGDVYFTLPQDATKVDRSKMKGGSSPNIIHSLDATHLMMTVQACREAGIKDFAMIHDSYGCHAADAKLMGTILRQQFTKLYSTDVLKDLYNQFKANLKEEFKALLLPPPVPFNTMESNAAESSDYFFALTFPHP